MYDNINAQLLFLLAQLHQRLQKRFRLYDNIKDRFDDLLSNKV